VADDPAGDFTVSRRSTSQSEDLLVADRWYFAYGSNMSRNRKEERTGTIRDARRCQLLGYRFAFNKRNSKVPGTAFANIVIDDTSAVWGVAYLCNQDAFERLDQFEGVRSGHYQHLPVSVVLDSGDTLNAITYVAGDAYVCEDTFPMEVYLETILVGAREHKLPEEYVGRIEALGRSA
jgi:gamma-glutamylcyclotransferase